MTYCKTLHLRRCCYTIGAKYVLVNFFLANRKRESQDIVSFLARVARSLIQCLYLFVKTES